MNDFKACTPDKDDEVIVICRDDSCHVAVWKGQDYDGKDWWIVKGPRGTGRRLMKRVLYWAPRPHLPEVAGDG